AAALRASEAATIGTLHKSRSTGTPSHRMESPASATAASVCPAWTEDQSCYGVARVFFVRPGSGSGNCVGWLPAEDTGDCGRGRARRGSTGLPGKSFDGLDGCGFDRVGGNKDVPAISDVDFGAGDAAWASEFPKAVCPDVLCKEAPRCRMFAYLKAGMATAQETRIPIRTPRMNCHRVAERCRSRGTSRVILGNSGVRSDCRSNVMVFECLSNCRHNLQPAGAAKNCRGGRPMGGVRTNQQPWYRTPFARLVAEKDGSDSPSSS